MFCAWCYTDTRRKRYCLTELWRQTQVRPETLATMPPLRMKHCFLPHMKVQGTEMPSMFQIHWLAKPLSYESGQIWNAHRASEGAGIQLCCWLAAYVICDENDGRRGLVDSPTTAQPRGSPPLPDEVWIGHKAFCFWLGNLPSTSQLKPWQETSGIKPTPHVTQ